MTRHRLRDRRRHHHQSPSHPYFPTTPLRPRATYPGGSAQNNWGTSRPADPHTPPEGNRPERPPLTFRPAPHRRPHRPQKRPPQSVPDENTNPSAPPADVIPGNCPG